jgi:AraC-like DNA-binding protein
VHTLQSAPAAPGLRQYVRAYAQRDIRWSGSDLIQPVPASLEHILEFEFENSPEIHYHDGTSESAHRIAVVGPHTHRGITLHLSGHVQSFAIFFQPFGLWQLFRIPVSELLDKAHRGEDLLGKIMEELWLKLAECASFDNRVASVESYLLERAARAAGRTATMKAAMYLFQCGGRCRIDTLACQSGVSARHLERLFSSDVGIRPKLFARIARFQSALDIKLQTPERCWLSIAHDFGYHDQMHMIRDFQSLSGAAPERLLAELGDTRPPALARSHLRDDKDSRTVVREI